jgi:hypothetical protein
MGFEKNYQNAMYLELKSRVQSRSSKQIKVYYKKSIRPFFWLDWRPLLFCELKACGYLLGCEHKVTLNYLKATDVEIDC